MRKSMSKKVITLVILATMLNSNMVLASEVVKKDETVYVTLDGEGKVEEEIVSNCLSSEKKNIEIKDKSELKDIKNIKGDEKPKIENNNLTWNMEGKDIYYQGKINKELPLNVEIIYELDNKKVKPEDIIGKSGKLALKIKYKNKEKHKVKIKDKEKEVYTPLTVATALTLPVDKFENLKVNGGKVVNDGKNQMIAFVNMPGLKESLGVDDNIIDIPDELEIKADVKNFSMEPIMVVATPELLIDDIEGIKSVDELVDGINKIQDASGKLTDATNKLANKQKEFKEGFEKYNNGVNEFTDGAETLVNGAMKASKGIEALFNGSYDLANGITIFSKKLDEFSIGINSLKEGATKIESGQNQVVQGMEACSEGVAILKEKKQLELEGLEQLEASTQSLEQIRDGLANVPGSEQLVQGLNQVIDGQKSGFEALKNGGNVFLGGLENLEVGINQTKGGAIQVLDGTSNLKNGAITLKDGSNKLKEASISLKDGANRLNSGLSELNGGLSGFDAAKLKIEEGRKTLSDGGNQLNVGSGKLASATEELSNKMEEFKKQGIDKMQHEANSKVGNIEDIIEAKDELVKLSKKYETFSGIGKDMNGNVKFVMRTSEIKEKNKDEQDKNEDEKKTVSIRKSGIRDIIKNLF